MTPAEILAEVSRWPLDWREAHAERVAIKVAAGISEDAAVLQAWTLYRDRAAEKIRTAVDFPLR